MPTAELTFPNNINVSVQHYADATPANPYGADIIYYSQVVPPPPNGTHNTAPTIRELGPIVAISGNTITVSYDSSTPLPGPNDFIMFAKARESNMSSLLGYFAEFRIRNNSTEKAEMYSISVDVTDSSK